VQSLPYLLPLLKDSIISDKPTPSQVRATILKILRQKDFSAATYILTIGQLIELYEPREDMEFWRQVIAYVPLVGLENVSQYCKLKGCIQHLSANVPELDFTGVLAYLDERYEKPYMQMYEGKRTEQIGQDHRESI
jgi:hypothetical protein